MPAEEVPNRAICRCNFIGSAPRREAGTRSSRGSTSRKSEGIREC